MFGIAWNEYIVIAVVALIVIGPKELPRVLRTIGQWTAKVRRMAAEFQGQFQEALREAEMADIRKRVEDIRDTAKGLTSGIAAGVASPFDNALNFQEATTGDAGPAPEAGKPGDAAQPADALPEAPPAAPLQETPLQETPLQESGAQESVEAAPAAAGPAAVEHPAAEHLPAGTAGPPDDAPVPPVHSVSDESGVKAEGVVHP
jgi:sec-independent protein translocase protein TatB